MGCREVEDERVYCMRDNGTGCDRQFVHKIFEMFERLHRIDEYEGTGIALALSQRIIQRRGGRLWAEAAPEQGATFSFTR